MVKRHLNVSLCQSSKHAASLQSKITSTSDTVQFQMQKAAVSTQRLIWHFVIVKASSDKL